MTQGNNAVVLLAHGARDQRWLEPFYRMRDLLQAGLGRDTLVALAFMEFTTPTFADAIAAIADAQKGRVLVVPVFLSGGGHVAHDIPHLIDPERAAHPEMIFTVSGAIGEEPEVVAGMIRAVSRLAAG